MVGVGAEVIAQYFPKPVGALTKLVVKEKLFGLGYIFFKKHAGALDIAVGRVRKAFKKPRMKEYIEQLIKLR